MSHAESAKSIIRRRRSFINRLHSWYHQFRRRLPWREQPSLYHTVVSEFMLQQTQVNTVLPYFNRWINVFPDFKTLASAPEAQVLKQWEGLGYYARARNLHKLAKALAVDAQIPTDAQAWLKLPGVGPYSAAAITSISFCTPVAVIDGNVIRILSRLTADNTVFNDMASAVKAFRPVADSLLDAEDPGDHNQAMMELGATVCRRSNPACLICPVAIFCRARAQGNPEAYPKLTRKKSEHIEVERIWMVHHGALLLRRSPKQAQRLANLYELPLGEKLSACLKDQEPIAVKMRGISNQRITEKIYVLKATPARIKKISNCEELYWVPLEKIHTLTLSGPHRKWITELLSAGA